MRLGVVPVPGSSTFLFFLGFSCGPTRLAAVASPMLASLATWSARHVRVSFCPCCPPSPSSPTNPPPPPDSPPPPIFSCPAMSTRLASMAPFCRRGLPSSAYERCPSCRPYLRPPTPLSCLWAFRHKRVFVQHTDAVGRGDGHDRRAAGDDEAQLPLHPRRLVRVSLVCVREGGQMGTRRHVGQGKGHGSNKGSTNGIEWHDQGQLESQGRRPILPRARRHATLGGCPSPYRGRRASSTPRLPRRHDWHPRAGGRCAAAARQAIAAVPLASPPHEQPARTDRERTPQLLNRLVQHQVHQGVPALEDASHCGHRSPSRKRKENSQ